MVNDILIMANAMDVSHFVISRSLFTILLRRFRKEPETKTGVKTEICSGVPVSLAIFAQNTNRHALSVAYFGGVSTGRK